MSAKEITCKGVDVKHHIPPELFPTQDLIKFDLQQFMETKSTGYNFTWQSYIDPKVITH